jgi:hypothetical protein
MSQAICRKALEGKTAAFAAANGGLQVAWENADFDPPQALHLRSFLLPLEVISQTLDMRHRQYEGVYQLSIVCPAGVGPGDGEALLPILDAAFSTASPIAVDGLKLYITRPMGPRQAIQEEGGNYVIPVSCSYRLDTI